MQKEIKRKLVLSQFIVLFMIIGLVAAALGTFHVEMEHPEDESGDSGNPLGATGASANNTIVRLVVAGNYTIVEDDDGIHEITMLTPGYWDMTSPGNPALPQAMMEILVPQDINWSSVDLNVVVLESSVLNGSYNIAPSPPFEAEVSDIDPKLDHEV
jgi:hypothetical protein